MRVLGHDCGKTTQTPYSATGSCCIYHACPPCVTWSTLFPCSSTCPHPLLPVGKVAGKMALELLTALAVCYATSMFLIEALKARRRAVHTHFLPKGNEAVLEQFTEGPQRDLFYVMNFSSWIRFPKVLCLHEVVSRWTPHSLMSPPPAMPEA